jgi:hypothetical protein
MERRRDQLIQAIGLFKLLKATLLVVLAIALLAELPAQLAEHAQRAVAWLGGRPGSELLERGVARLWGLGTPTAHRLAAAALCYAAMFLAEGVGLFLRKTWAEWFTVIETASFIPLELYELAKGPRPWKVAALVGNVLILAYLAARRMGAMRARGQARRLPATG